MPQIGPRKVPAGVAAARRIDRAVVLGKLRVLDVERALAGEELAVPGVPGRQHAVEHVDAAGHGLDEVERACRHPSGSAAGRPAGAARSRSTTLIHSLVGLADAQAADRVALEPNRHSQFRRSSRADPGTSRPARCRTAPGRGWSTGARRSPSRSRNRVAASRAPIARSARATSSMTSGVDGSAGHSSSTIAMSEPRLAWMSTAVSGVSRCALPSRCERNCDAVLLDLAALRQAEHLVAAAVGEDRPGPADEAVEPAAAGDQLVAGPQIQVIGVAEDDAARRPPRDRAAVSALTAPWVPTGMKTGVSIVAVGGRAGRRAARRRRCG